MSRLLSLLMLVLLTTLLSITYTVLISEGQTPPPATGDWVINDSTTYSYRQISVNGTIIVSGSGSLTFTNVEIHFFGNNAHGIFVDNNARFTMTGGSISSEGIVPYNLTLKGRSVLDNVTITGSKGILVNSWNTQITNCTMISPNGDGILVDPTDSYTSPLVISDNRVVDAMGLGINLSIFSTFSTEISLVCVGNEVTGSVHDGIGGSVTCDKGSIHLEGNVVTNSSHDGINVTVDVRVLALYLDGTHVDNNIRNGLHIVVETSIPLRRTLNNVTALDNGVTGVYIEYLGFHWDRPVFRGWNVSDNEGAGIHLINMICATLEDSHVVNGNAKNDYICEDAQLAIYRTIQRKAKARVSGSGSRVDSYFIANISVVWQNGMPCRYATVEFEDHKGDRLFSMTTDYEGSLGTFYTWDWFVEESRSMIIEYLVAYLSIGPNRLQGPTLQLDGDLDTILVFVDEVPPSLTLDSYYPDHFSTLEKLSLHGTARDDLSGMHLVQVSFDPWGDWTPLLWINASGTLTWSFTLDPFPTWFPTFYVRAFDIANYPNGNCSMVTLTIRTDIKHPDLGLMEPINGSIHNSTWVNITGMVASHYLTLEANRIPVVPHPDGRFAMQIELVEGLNTVWVNATFSNGHTVIVGRWVTVDTTPPNITVTTEDGLTNRESIFLEGHVDELDCLVFVDGDPVDWFYRGEWTYNLTLEPAINNITVRATDAAGNTAQLLLTFILDQDAPGFFITEPSPGSLINITSVWVEGYVDTDVQNDQVLINGYIASLDDTRFSILLSGLTEGLFEITVRGVDLADNVGYGSVQVVVDTIPPMLDIIDPAEGLLTNAPSQNVSGLTEQGAVVKVQGETVEVVGNEFATLVDLEEGQNTIRIEVWDEAMNYRRIILNVTSDTIPPILVVNGLENDTLTAMGHELTISGSTEQGAYATIVIGTSIDYLSVDFMGDFSYTLVPETPLTQVQVNVKDEAGNSNQITFLIEWAPPVPPDEPDKVPVMTLVGGTLAITIGLIAVASVETTRYSLLAFLAPLFTKIAKDKVLDNKTRYGIHGLIVENPGVHYSAIMREYGLTNGVAAYHLSVLEREGYIRSARDGIHRRFYTSTTKVPPTHDQTPEELRKAALSIIHQRPGISQKEISEEIGVNRDTVGYHLRELVKNGDLETSREGKYVVYRTKR